MKVKGNKIMEFMLANRHTIQSFAEATGLAPSTVGKILRSSKVNIKTLGILTDVTGIPYNELLEGD